MENDNNNSVEQAVSRTLQLEGELEAEGSASTGGDALSLARAALHQWVDTVTAVVASPGVGRVTLIHANGKESRIASPELPYLLARPVGWET